MDSLFFLHVFFLGGVGAAGGGGIPENENEENWSPHKSGQQSLLNEIICTFFLLT